MADVKSIRHTAYVNTGEVVPMTATFFFKRGANMKGWDLGNGQYSNMTPEGGPCCKMSPPAKSEPAAYSFELEQRLDNELTMNHALRGADLLRVVATTHPAETQARLRDAADGIERLCNTLTRQREWLSNARKAVRDALDKMGALTAQVEQDTQEIKSLRARLYGPKKRKRTAKA